MAYDPSTYRAGPSEQELRIRAAQRVARRRQFTGSAVVLGGLIVLNLFFYAQSHRVTWLILDAAFAATLAVRAWMTFGADRTEDADIQREVARMRQSAVLPQQAPTDWQQAIPPAAPAAASGASTPPVPPPPPSDASNWNL